MPESQQFFYPTPDGRKEREKEKKRRFMRRHSCGTTYLILRTMAEMEVARVCVAMISAELLQSKSPGSLKSLQAEKRMLQEQLDAYKYPVLALPNKIISRRLYD
ncbi:hypothetical protein GGX14DRAFT_400287 [Mycena pura]|uniref:Uncharacterized protein n=1 Tax=Mycena pura TaxID=153505 RepID=A0AAD6Y7R6_9AGAR|nr:hypothetical protein GGX14DRAFT_400287 [Mycena pura]